MLLFALDELGQDGKASKLRHDAEGSIELSARQYISQVRLQQAGLRLVCLGSRFSPL